MKTVLQAVNYLAARGITTLAELDAVLSSVSEKSDAIRSGTKAAKQPERAQTKKHEQER